MNAKANFKRGGCYYYAHKATMACAFLGGAMLLGEKKAIGLYLKCPEPRADFHRVEINVIRTKAEAKALNRKYAKLRAKRRADAKTHGVRCNKVPHDPRQAYLHEAGHDGPYDVDGVAYCGRCHGAI